MVISTACMENVSTDSWWHHQMETFSALLAICLGNSTVTGEFPLQKASDAELCYFFYLCLNKCLSKQSWGLWFEMPSHSLWRHCNGLRKSDACICISKLSYPIGSDNGLSPVWGHAIIWMYYCYASAFRRRRHYVFGLSVRPSVRPKPEIPSFDLYMGPLVHPTNRNRFTACPSVRPSVCPSVRPERFPGICRRMHGGIGLKFYMLMYLDHPENAWRKWTEILHADVSWPPSELISLWPRSVDFSNFGAILT